MPASFDKYFLVFDLDGSFLDCRSRLVDKNLDAVRRFIDGGGLFSFATGRTNLSVTQFLGRTPINAPAICCNGAEVYDFEKRKFLRYFPLPLSIRALMGKISSRFPETGICVFTAKGFFALQRDSYTARLETEEEKFNGGGKPSYDLDWMKVVVTGEHPLLEKVEAYLKTVDTAGIDYVYSCPFYLEFLAAGVSKGARIPDLKNLYPERKLCAAGDFYNDLNMLRAADISACVKGAPDELKKACDYILCGNDEGAAADFIRILSMIKAEDSGAE